HHDPADEGPLHAAAPLRVRRGCLVLALRRRRLARPVRRRVLALNLERSNDTNAASSGVCLFSPMTCLPYLPMGMPVGWIHPAQYASRMQANNSTDSVTRT